MTREGPGIHEEATEPEARRFEKRWWMWGLAIATLVVTSDLRSRLGRSWDEWVLIESIASVVAIGVTCSRWRGKIVSGFLAIGGAMCVLKAIQVVLGT